ncbi:HDIG domain-containing protein [Candidatus Beckwithbacteria bacterium]|nr:HDIG domain-containing protein [Candidatus Beckwithbacteria bacterium]
MNRQEALDFVNSTTSNKNLVKHMLAVGACMKALARYFNEDEEMWEVAGIVHDGDYEMFKDTPEKHPSKIVEMLEEKGVDPKIIKASLRHGWGWKADISEPETNMEWSLYACDELTGLITAVTLVRPSKKLADVKVEDVLKKWGKKDFAKGALRENIDFCEPKLGIKREDFIAICLKAMQGISNELGL